MILRRISRADDDDEDDDDGGDGDGEAHLLHSKMILRISRADGWRIAVWDKNLDFVASFAIQFLYVSS